MTATMVLFGMVLTILVHPDVDPLALGVLGGCGLLLFGVDIPWQQIPWKGVLGREPR